jgi:hypothetical protein
MNLLKKLFLLVVDCNDNEIYKNKINDTSFCSVSQTENYSGKFARN